MTRIIVTYSAAGTHVQTTLDYLSSFKRMSGDVEFLHVTHDAGLGVSLNQYDAVIQSYCARLCFEGYVASEYQQALKDYRGLKILAVQDEYNRTNVLKKAIIDLGFRVVLTCVPHSSLQRVYPPHEFPGVHFENVLTGYIPDDLIDQPITPIAERPITIGYRGRDLGAVYGRLGYDKFEIGRRMKQVCEQRGVVHDIAMDEASRIYGEAWVAFVGSCRAMLGTESGSNVFDFDGSIEAAYNSMTEAKGRKPTYDEFAPFTAACETEVSMGQISPRVFECAALRTPMILFPGGYSGAIEPGEHYIELSKDFSNVDDVLVQLDDIEALNAMADRTYNHLVGSGQFGYDTFASEVSGLVERYRQDFTPHGQRVQTTIDKPWLIETPTPTPKSFAEFSALTKKTTLAVYVGEIARLCAIAAAELPRFRGANVHYRQWLSATDLPEAESFEQTIDQVEQRFEQFSNERGAVIDPDGIAKMRDDLDATLGLYERQVRQMCLDFDELNKRCNQVALLQKFP